MNIFLKTGLWGNKKLGHVGELNITKYIKDLIAETPAFGDYIPLTDKQNSLATDGSGIKIPTVDAINSIVINTAFINKPFNSVMSLAFDYNFPNVKIDVTGNLSLSITGTVNGDSGIVNLYFSGTEVATLNGAGPLVLTGAGSMISVYFIHDTDGLKWYQDEVGTTIVDTSNLAVKDGTRLYHELLSGYSQTITNVGVNCTTPFIDPTMIGWEIIKSNGEKAIIATIPNFTSFTTIEPFATDSTNITVTAKAPSMWVKSNGDISFYNKDGQLKFSINTDGSMKIGDSITQLFNGNMTLTNLWLFGEMFFDTSSSSVHVPQYGSFNSGLGTNVDVKLERYTAGVWAVLDGAGNPGNLRANKLIMTSNSTYANDAAADADANLVSGSFYMIAGDRTIKRKP